MRAEGLSVILTGPEDIPPYRKICRALNRGDQTKRGNKRAYGCMSPSLLITVAANSSLPSLCVFFKSPGVNEIL